MNSDDAERTLIRGAQNWQYSFDSLEVSFSGSSPLSLPSYVSQIESTSSIWEDALRRGCQSR